MTTVERRPAKLVRIADPSIPVEHKQVYEFVARTGVNQSVIRRQGDPEHLTGVVPSEWLEPVGLDMAEPPDGTVVRVTWREGSMPVVAERDDKGATEADERWHGADGLHYRWHEFAHAAFITVLEPRDDTLHTALVALHADLAAKAETLQRVAAGTGYAYCRDALGKLLAVDGFRINGRDQADSGE